uniref:Uncharacterized protein n=1 Tax=Tetraselmis sp. GSL018 TaxID=582737 RepID=A0A061RFJ2_9CHLO|mmetsp:Transcript_37674/g.89503  ORF Transcript_37674/g.89503 Transcript_37674/m.89503 type:complete len:172 (+) Transcript_37674:180-695(+)
MEQQSRDLQNTDEPEAGIKPLPKQNIAEVISRLKDIAKEDVERLKNMTVEELRKALAKSEGVCEKIAKALAVELEWKNALLSALKEHDLNVPPEPARETTPTLVNASETASSEVQASSNEKEVLHQKWAQKQAEGRQKLAAAKHERAHCQELAKVLETNGIPVPAKPQLAA